MRRHIVRAFGIVFEVVGILRDQAIEKFFQITTRSRIGIFHYDQTATGMLDKNSQNPIANARVAQQRFDFVCNFVSAFA